METKLVKEEGHVRIPIGKVVLHGNLLIPEKATRLVAFAHGSGSSRHSPRNQFVARRLREAGLGTMLFDLLTLDEEAVDLDTGKQRFDIGLLSQRLIAATDWIKSNRSTQNLKLGYFGASTGAAAALAAAAKSPSIIGAIVSRGGRPDMVEPVLKWVKAPTLLIVGGKDTTIIELNREAFDMLQIDKQLVLVPGATHLFEESYALERVAELARDWFIKYLA